MKCVDAFKFPDFPSVGMKSASHMVLVFFSLWFLVSKILVLRCTEMYSWIGIMFSFCPELEMLCTQGVNTIQNRYFLHFWSSTEYLNRYFVMESDPSLLKKYQLSFCVVWQSGELVMISYLMLMLWLDLLCVHVLGLVWVCPALSVFNWA